MSPQAKQRHASTSYGGCPPPQSCKPIGNMRLSQRRQCIVLPRSLDCCAKPYSHPTEASSVAALGGSLVLTRECARCGLGARSRDLPSGLREPARLEFETIVMKEVSRDHLSKNGRSGGRSGSGDGGSGCAVDAGPRGAGCRSGAWRCRFTDRTHKGKGFRRGGFFVRPLRGPSRSIGDSAGRAGGREGSQR